MRLISFLSTALLALATVTALVAQDLDQGIELYNSRKYGDAERVLRDVVKNQPDNARAHSYLGAAMLGQGRLNEAEESLKKAEELDGKLDSAKAGLARVALERKQLDRATELIDKLQDLNPDHPDLPFLRGLHAAGKRDWNSAAELLEKAIEKNPSNAHAYYYAGLVYSNLKRRDKMVRNFEEFLKLAPNAPEAEKVSSLLRSTR